MNHTTLKILLIMENLKLLVLIQILGFHFFKKIEEKHKNNNNI